MTITSTRFVARRLNNLNGELKLFVRRVASLENLQANARKTKAAKQEAYELLCLASQGLASSEEEAEISAEYNEAKDAFHSANAEWKKAGGKKTLAKSRRGIKSIRVDIKQLKSKDQKVHEGLKQSPFAGLWAAMPELMNAK